MSEPSPLCPIAVPVDRPSAPPVPEALAYSFTLPAAPRSPAIARSATRTILRAHGLDDVMDAAVQVVGELATCSCRLAPSAEVYVSLRYRDDAHPRPTRTPGCSRPATPAAGRHSVCWPAWSRPVRGSGASGTRGNRVAGPECGRFSPGAVHVLTRPAVLEAPAREVPGGCCDQGLIRPDSNERP